MAQQLAEDKNKEEVEAQKARVPQPPRLDEPEIKNEATDVPINDSSMDEGEAAGDEEQSQVPMMISRNDEEQTRSELR